MRPSAASQARTAALEGTKTEKEGAGLPAPRPLLPEPSVPFPLLLPAMLLKLAAAAVRLWPERVSREAKRLRSVVPLQGGGDGEGSGRLGR